MYIVHRLSSPQAGPAQKALARLSGWHAQWDRDTDVPLRAWGPSIAAPGTASDPGAAEAFARTFLAQHLELLAPGAQVADFVLVANQTDPSGERRTVAFAQPPRRLSCQFVIRCRENDHQLDVDRCEALRRRRDGER